MKKVMILLVLSVVLIAGGCGDASTPSSTSLNLDRGVNVIPTAEISASEAYTMQELLDGALTVGDTTIFRRIQIEERPKEKLYLLSTIEDMARDSVKLQIGSNLEDWLGNPVIVVVNATPAQTAQWLFLLHHGYTPIEDMKRVTTLENETSVELPLRYPLPNEDIRLLRYESASGSDNLKVVSYNRHNQTVRIDGFAPSLERIIALHYLGITNESTQYLIESIGSPARLEDEVQGVERCPSGSENWIKISDPAPILNEMETRNILISMVIPQGSIGLPRIWEYRISVRPEKTGVVTGYQQEIIVILKDDVY